ncbi:MAG: hypothetical protein MK171_11860 [Pirellulales bacterium]|nr:hypothetical protein [Pirellulales bacterium]
MLRWLPALLVFGFTLLCGPGLGPQTRGAGANWQALLSGQKTQTSPTDDYALTADRGPWLVMAASYSGPSGEKEARKLVHELRSRHKMPACYFGMTFQMDDANPGRGIDNYGGRVKRRYQRGDQVVQHAVLVGDFPSLGDKGAQDALKRIKHLSPQSLSPQQGKSTSQSLAAVRKFHNLIHKKIGTSQKKGPLGHAFLTKNPLLPKEYFMAQGVDREVAKWNESVKYSLMKCPGNFSMRVATFKGRVSLKAANEDGQKGKIDKVSHALVTAADNAHFLTSALRKKGWEAYEFHDRYESYVTVGSFREGVAQPNGQIQLKHPDAKTIFDTFGARSPQNIFNRPAEQDLMVEQQQKAKFQKLLGSATGNVSKGFHPKRFVGLPFDIDPTPVRVPRQSISSAYVRN